MACRICRRRVRRRCGCRLFRELAEENPKKALPLLEPLSPEKRRDALFDSTWLGFVNVSPDDFLRFLAEVPDAESPEEQERKLKGWTTRARADLWRYGDDYVEWVKHMPPGIHREAAMNGDPPGDRRRESRAGP